MIIEKKNTAYLLPADYNPRKDLKPGDAEYEKLKHSIEQFGYVEPVIWNKTTGRVVGGHQRLKVLIDMGISEVECVVVEMDESKEKALNVALNKISGDWDKDKLALLISDLQGADFDVSLTGFEPAEIDDLFKDTLKAGIKEDDFDVGAELEKPTMTKPGDIWTLGRHRLICGDSTKLETYDLLMGSTKANLVITDPPYNVNYEGSAGKIKNDNMADDPMTHLPAMATHKRRVAGYARVSTDSDEQFTSYEAQVDYYTKFIQSKPDWEFVKVYTDEGISGCNTKRREGFKEMIADALAGKIDLIVTKSVSRFARNTVDSLTTIRKLKEHGTECYFEKEGIYTFDGKGELLITIMSSLAQEESRSISENITWGQRKSFSDGKVHLPYKRFLGYEKGEDGRPTIVESEAEIVRLIYRLFLDGKSQTSICRELESLGIPSPGGKPTWSKTTVTSILQNEKYKGDALLQKKFTVDFLEKKMKPNEGEVPQYYVENSHPAIIIPDEWDHVQAELSRRKSLGRAYSGKSVFSAKLVCEECGSFFGSKVWHSTDRYRRTIWQCNRKFANEERCHTPTLYTETIQKMFIRAYNQLMSDRKQTIVDCELARKYLTDFAALDAEIERQHEETQVIAEMVKAAVRENASTAQSQEAYLKKHEALTERYETAAKELERLQTERTFRTQQDKSIALFIRTFKKLPDTMTEWDDTIWTVMVEKGIVHTDGEVTFVFKNGTEIKIS